MHSIYRRASKPVSITPLVYSQLPIKRVGLTEFTFTAIYPYLCGYEGKSIFLDADMLCLGDIHELVDLAGDYPVSVVKNKLRFEWPSLMVFNNARCTDLTPQYIETSEPQALKWANGEIGSLPPEWNILVGYDEPIPNPKASPLHPRHSLLQRDQRLSLLSRMGRRSSSEYVNGDMAEIMGNSVHAQPVLSAA
jgi:hypothetical protein